MMFNNSIILFFILKLLSAKCSASQESMKVKIAQSNVLACESSCIISIDCIIEAKILYTSSNDLQAKAVGRYITANGSGNGIAICFRKSDPNMSPIDWKVFAFQSSADNNGLKLSLLQPNQPNLNPNLKPSIESLFKKESKSVKISCSNEFGLDEMQHLYLIRITENGTRIPVIIDPSYLTGTMTNVPSSSTKIKLTYSHEFEYTREYMNNTFLCYTIDSASSAVDYRESDKLLYDLEMIPKFKIEAYILGEHNKSVELEEMDFTKHNYTLTCKETTGYPTPKVYWTNSTSHKIDSNAIDITVENFTSMCCHASQLVHGEEKEDMKCLNLTGVWYYKDCNEVKQRIKHAENGIYIIYPTDATVPWKVYCDFDQNGENWIVVQRRSDGSVDFARGWDEYVYGFGGLENEFWMGLWKMYQITKSRSMKIKFDLWDSKNEYRYAEYASFSLSGPNDNYRLFISGYSGNASDAMRYHNKKQFTANANCGRNIGEGGWWYTNSYDDSCYLANLNGPYLAPGVNTYKGIVWKPWKHSTLKKTEIKVQFK